MMMMIEKKKWRTCLFLLTQLSLSLNKKKNDLLMIIDVCPLNFFFFFLMMKPDVLCCCNDPKRMNEWIDWENCQWSIWSSSSSLWWFWFLIFNEIFIHLMKISLIFFHSFLIVSFSFPFFLSKSFFISTAKPRFQHFEKFSSSFFSFSFKYLIH